MTMIARSPSGLEHIGKTVDNMVLRMSERIKQDCLSRPFTAERSITVDQIDFIQAKLKEGHSFHDATKLMAQWRHDV